MTLKLLIFKIFILLYLTLIIHNWLKNEKTIGIQIFKKFKETSILKKLLIWVIYLIIIPLWPLFLLLTWANTIKYLFLIIKNINKENIIDYPITNYDDDYEKIGKSYVKMQVYIKIIFKNIVYKSKKYAF